MRLLHSVVVVAAVIGLALSPVDEVVWQMSAPEKVEAGTSFQLELTAKIADGWYVYALDSPAGKPLAVLFDPLPEGIRLGSPEQASATDSYDENFGSPVRYFEESATVSIRGDLAPDLEPGAYELTGKLDYQYCNDRLCIPKVEPFRFSFAVIAATGATAATAARGNRLGPRIESGAGFDPGSTAIPNSSTEEPADIADDPAIEQAAPRTSPLGVSPTRDLDVARSGGLLPFLLLAIGAGLAALLTPCVFPMIPLTISFFSHQAGNRSRAIRMALVYGLSIVVIFTGLGVLMAALAGAAGAQLIATNPWINLFIGLVFVVFALSLLGLFELRLPYRFVNYVNDRGSKKGGTLGVLFMGLTLTLVSFSCTAPFVGGLLAATVMNEWMWPVAGMLAFSLTFATPFVLFAMFPKWLSSLPKSGVWMNSVKVTLGFIELAAAFKFISNADLVWGWGVVSRTLVIAGWIVLSFLAGVYLLGKLRLSEEPALETIGTGRLLVAICFFGLSLYMFPGLLGAPLNSLDAYLPPRQATDVSLSSLIGRSGTSETPDGLDWHGNDAAPYGDVMDAAFEQAGTAGKPILIDFTGYTCTNCRQMEANVFPSEAVKGRLRDRFVLMRLFTDDAVDGPDLQRYQLQLTGSVALPTYAVIDAEGTLLHRWQGVASTQEFSAFLDEAAERFASSRPYEDMTAVR